MMTAMKDADAIGRIYEFESFQLDAANRALTCRGLSVPLAPKIFDTLLVLVERHGQVIEKDELMRLVWPDSFVEENNLAQNIFHLRRALGEQAGGRQYIETISRRGYRFVAEVRTPRGETAGPTTTETPTAIEPEKTPSTIPQSAVAGRLSARTIGLGAAAVALLLLGIKFFNPLIGFSDSSAAFVNPSIVKLTNTLDARAPAVSRDGKHLAFVVVEAGKQSLRLRQLATDGETQLVAPAPVRFRGLAFSPDGQFIYYTVYENVGAGGVLLRVPLLGGTPARLNEDVDSPVTFSPDGRRMAFVRYFSEAAIILADLDGGNERKLAVRQKPSFYDVDGPAWSPDGQFIACAVADYDAPTPYGTFVGVDVATGLETRLTERKFSSVGQLVWLNEGREFVAIAGDSSAPLHRDQVWSFTWPGGEARQITNDLNAYRWLSALPQNAGLVTVQASRVAQIQLVPDGDASRAREITFGSGDTAGEGLGMTWTPDNQLIYASHLNGNTDLWLMDAGGGVRRRLTDNPGADYQPAVSPDGRYLLFASARNGSETAIWRMELSSGQSLQLTFGKDDENPTLTPDGKWVLYTTRGHGHWTLRRVPLAGGAAQPLTQEATQKPVVSPDGKLIACYFYDEEKRSYRLALLPIEGGRAMKYFDAPVTDLLPIGWTPDGQALTYVDTRDGVSNLWRQPIDGGAAQPLTAFKSGRIFRYAWSRDGKMPACERGSALNDLALIRQR